MSVAVAPTRLDELAQRIRDAHAACDTERTAVNRAVLSMLHHGIAAGEALWEAKEQIPYGQWQRWLRTNIEISDTLATSYMRVARHKDLILGTDGVNTMQKALAFLQERNLTSHGLTLEQCQEIGQYAKKHGPRAAAQEFNVAYSTAQRYGKGVLPNQREKRRAAIQKRAEERKHKEARRTVERASRRTRDTTSVGELHTAAGRLQPFFARAKEEAETKAARDALKRAEASYQEMRGAIQEVLIEAIEASL